MEVIAGVVRSYYDALLSAEELNATNQAMRSAQADLERAESVRAAGMSTDADVLSIRVHLAGVREEQIRRAADLDVARAALNDALGLPLDTLHTFTTRVDARATPGGTLAGYETNALAGRPEARQVKLAVAQARNQAAAHTASYSAGGCSHRLRGRSAEVLRPGRRQLAGFHRAAVESVQRRRRPGAHRGKHGHAASGRSGPGAADSAIQLQVRRACADLTSARSASR